MPSAQQTEFAGYAAERFQQYLAIESAGLFWIGAELGILFAMAEGRRFFSQTPIPERFALPDGFGWRATLYLGGFILLCAAVFGLHFGLANETPTLQWQAHTTVWSAFIVAWVVLECLIVWQGYRIFLILTHKMGVAPYSKTALCTAGIMFVLFAFLLAAPLLLALANPPSELLAAPIREHTSISAFERMIEPYQNGVYFLLRFAGVFWITVEWVAAVVLVRAWFLFKRRVGA